MNRPDQPQKVPVLGQALTTDPAADTGYGDGTIVAVHVRPEVLELDDEFPDGRKDFAIDAPRKIVTVVNAFMSFDQST